MFPLWVMMDTQVRRFYACPCSFFFLKKLSFPIVQRELWSSQVLKATQLDDFLLKSDAQQCSDYLHVFLLVMRLVITEKCVEIQLFGLTVSALVFLFPLECQSHVKVNSASWHNPTNLKHKNTSLKLYPLLVITLYFSFSLPDELLKRRSLLPQLSLTP